jgi:hypothetical protein
MILASVATKGRYDTTLPLTLMALINQTRRIDKIVIFDDNTEPKDMRLVQHYKYMFEIMDIKGIAWEWIFAQKKGQHYSHQTANRMGFEFVFRCDDDCVPDPNVLETLLSYMKPDVGGVAGAILTPPWTRVIGATGKIENIDAEPNIQWDFIKEVKEMDHLHCTFLYRAGIHDYNLNLSKVAHREETLFTYELKQKGYRLIVVPNANTWHMKNHIGGIRDDIEALFDHDNAIFRNIVFFKGKTIVVLDNGMGDHIIFKKVLPLIKNPEIFSCYPEIVPGRSIAEAQQLLGDLTPYNIYAKMDQWKWKGSIEEAFKYMYGVKNG